MPELAGSKLGHTCQIGVSENTVGASAALRLEAPYGVGLFDRTLHVARAHLLHRGLNLGLGLETVRIGWAGKDFEAERADTLRPKTPKTQRCSEAVVGLQHDIVM